MMKSNISDATRRTQAAIITRATTTRSYKYDDIGWMKCSANHRIPTTLQLQSRRTHKTTGTADLSSKPSMLRSISFPPLERLRNSGDLSSFPRLQLRCNNYHLSPCGSPPPPQRHQHHRVQSFHTSSVQKWITTFNIHEDGKTAVLGKCDKEGAASAGEETSQFHFFGLGGRFIEWYSRQLDVNPWMTKSITSGMIAGLGDFLCQAFITKSPALSSSSSSSSTIGQDGNQRTDETTENVANNNQVSETQGSTNSSTVDGKTRLFPSWWDYMGTARFVGIGTFYVGPIIHVWFEWLAKHIPGKGVGRVAQRVVADQFVFTPVFIVVWLSIMWTLENIMPSSRSSTSQAPPPLDLPMSTTAHHRQQQRNDDKEDEAGKSTTTTTDTPLIWINQMATTIVQRLKAELPEIMVVNWVLWIPAQVVTFGFVPVKFQVLFNNVVELVWNAYLSYVNSSSTTPNGEDDSTTQDDDDDNNDDTEGRGKNEMSQKFTTIPR